MTEDEYCVAGDLEKLRMARQLCNSIIVDIPDLNLSIISEQLFKAIMHLHERVEEMMEGEKND